MSRRRVVGVLGCTLLALMAVAQTGPRQVVDYLDQITQARFQNNDLETFGLSRIVSDVPGHQNVYPGGQARVGVLRPSDAEEKALLERALAAKRDFVIAFLHLGGKPTTGRPTPVRTRPATEKPYLAPLVVSDPERIPLWQKARVAVVTGGDGTERANANLAWLETVEVEAIAALPRLQAGRATEKKLGAWLLTIKPVRATESACLKCHTDARIGQTLGGVVYLVRN